MMIARVLSIVAPLFVYGTLVILIVGVWRQRSRMDWLALVPAAAAFMASVAFLPDVHRLFFDEDIYINMAENLTHAPVAQITMVGGPSEIRVSSYYKEPAGWPVLLSLVFWVTGRSETVAFIIARIMYALAVAAVFQLAREVLKTRGAAFIASTLFAAAPVCFWFSVSAGTDIPAALFVVLGLWGLTSRNAALAAGGFAMAAQTRLELMALLPLVWVGREIPLKWKIATCGLVVPELIHVGWVMSVAPTLAQAEKVRSTFSPAYVWGNFITNVKYLFDPREFPIAIPVLGVVAWAWSLNDHPGAARHPSFSRRGMFGLQILVLFVVYLLFYAGSFTINPRYAIQLLVPMVLLAMSTGTRLPVLAALVLSAAIPYVRPMQLPDYVQMLATDHRVCVAFASQLGPNDIVISTENQIFLNQGRRAMNAVFASERRQLLDDELTRGRHVWYHSGIRTNIVDAQEWRTDRWMKSNYELHLIDSHEVGGLRIAFYEVLLKPIDREARLGSAFER